MFCIYCLYSLKFDQIYIGYTEGLINRFHSHNSLARKGHTLKYRPWMVAYVEFLNSKIDAVKREKQLKSAKGREFLRKYISENYL